MLSISQNNICLPARAFKTINEIRERTKATVPLLPPPRSLLFCSSSFAITMQTFSSLSAPPAPPTVGTKTPHADRQRLRTEARPNKQKLTRKLMQCCSSRLPPRTHVSPPANLLLCPLFAKLTEINEPKRNQQWLYKHYTVLE